MAMHWHSHTTGSGSGLYVGPKQREGGFYDNGESATPGETQPALFLLCQERERQADSPGGSQMTVNGTLLECGLRLSIPPRIVNAPKA